MSPSRKPSDKHSPLDAFVAGTDPLAVGPPALMHAPAELVGVQPDPPVYDPKAAEQLLAAYLPRLRAIGADRLKVPRVDMDAVVRALLGVYAFTQAAPVLAAYTAAATAGHFDLVNLARLRDGALILMHAFRLASAAGALKSSAKVPAELDRESDEVEKRMQRVCEGMYPDDAAVLELRPGIGFLDRAYDLLGYADVYESKPGVAGHPEYRDTDRAAAQRLGGALLVELSKDMNPEQKQAFDTLRRTWTFVQPVYFEVQQVGLAALRYDPERARRFPSLYAVGRSASGRRKPKGDPGSPAVTQEPSPPAKGKGDAK